MIIRVYTMLLVERVTYTSYRGVSLTAVIDLTWATSVEFDFVVSEPIQKRIQHCRCSGAGAKTAVSIKN